jgi:putrescine---pyruvate transaminase
VRKVGPTLERRLHALKDLPLVGDVRGSHFMMCTEYVANKQTRQLLPDGVNIGKRISNHCEARGLIVRPLAHLNIMSPPLVMTEAEVDELVTGLAAGIKAAASSWRLAPRAGRSTSWRSPPPARRPGGRGSRS